MNKLKQKQLGAFYTSNTIIKYMVDNILDKIKITKETRILEPSCGDGAFLLYIRDYLLNLNFSLNEIEDMLYGVDIDKETIEKCIDNIGFSKNIICGNTLFMDFDIEFDVVIGNPPYVRHEKIKDLKPLLQKSSYKSYNGTADLYIYFFEQGYRLLKDNGILSYITSNKYTRAKYGKEFREFVLANTKILEYIDFNGVKVFESATVDTSILSYQKSKEKESSFLYCSIDEKYKKGTPLEKFVTQKGFEYPQSDLSVESFSFSSPKELAIKKKIEKIGIPLKDWDININYGIKTGFNEAFIIDGKTKDELIAKDSKSAKIIKPILRGKDIKKYSYEFDNKWLINSHNNPPIDIEEYPAIKEHLDKYYDKLAKRSDKGETPYNLRSCAYWKDFEKEKIIYPCIMSKESSFAFDSLKLYPPAPANIISGKNIKYLLAVLNSKLIYFSFKKYYMGGGINGELKTNNLLRTPIPKISKEAQKPFEILVNKIIKQKENDEDTQELETELDNMIYKLYGLNNDEIDIVEGR